MADREQTLLAPLWWAQLETEHLMLLFAFILSMGKDLLCESENSMDGSAPSYTFRYRSFSETSAPCPHRMGGGGESVDLRNNQITVRELLSNPASKKVLARRFPRIINLPVVKASGNLTLARVMELGTKFVPQEQIQAAWQELKRL